MKNETCAKKVIAYIVLSLFTLSMANVSAETYSDQKITKSIKQSLRNNNYTKNTSVKINTKNGLVILSGTVKSPEEVSTLIRVSESEPGVVNVDTSQLKADYSRSYFADSFTTAKIKSLFIKNNLWDDSENVPTINIHVETVNGIVYLSGFVDTEQQKQLAEDIANSIKEVKGVKSTLRVAPS